MQYEMNFLLHPRGFRISLVAFGPYFGGVLFCPGHKHLGIPPRTQITLFCFKKPSSVGFIAHSTSKDSDLKCKRGTDEAYYNIATWGKPGNTNIMLAKEICFDEKVFPWVINSSKFKILTRDALSQCVLMWVTLKFEWSMLLFDSLLLLNGSCVTT